MSSILDALKKAERESTTDRGADTPWPAPLSVNSPFRQGTFRWWVSFGIVAVLCVCVVVLWLARRPDATRPLDLGAAVPSSHQTRHRASPSVVEAPKSNVVVSLSTLERPAKTMVWTSSQVSTENTRAAAVKTTTPMDGASPVQPEIKPPRVIVPPPATMRPPPPLTLEQTQRRRGTPKTEAVIAAPENANRPPAWTAETIGRRVAASPEPDKTFRNDPRIDLQALVWAPEAAARFVVINNRLLKEGGAVDTIIVVKINPDDVLLADGSDRWHQAFKIR